MKVSNLKSIQIKLASPKEILSWSKGEVLKPETINYRTLKPEKDGLFCERIFGPTKDYRCYCGKYRGIRYKGIVCDRCGVTVTTSIVRRERMGHIKLAVPVAHIWFLRGIPSRIGMVLNISREKLEKVVYFVAYIITSVSEKDKQAILKEIEKEYQLKVKSCKQEVKNQKQLNRKLKELNELRRMALSEVELIKPLKVLSEMEYRELSMKYGEIFEAATGAEALYDMFREIDLGKEIEKIKEEIPDSQSVEKQKILRQLHFFQSMLKADIRPEWMFLTIVPILPPDLRPMVQLDGGRYASSDLNDLYRRVINRNNRLKYLLQISAPEVIIRNEKRMLQEAVDALIDNGMRTGTLTRATTGGRRLLKSLADMLKGKRGRFRRNLLGKRVDYSGRGVIVVGPELQIDQVGLPKEMALEIFKPFVIKELLSRELVYNVRGASRLIEEQTDDVWAILEDVIKNRFVLLNRAPTLHRISIQAFKPILTEGKAIKIPPLVCSAFNADFDGDQMAVHLPLSGEAQREAQDIMLSSHNLLKPASGRPIVNPTQDVILGVYWLSTFKDGAKGTGKVFSSVEEALLAYTLGYVDLKAKIRLKSPLKSSNPLPKDKKKNLKIAKVKSTAVKLVETSVGRTIFNNVLPPDFPFYNEMINSKKLEKIIRDIIQEYGEEKSSQVIDEIKNIGFEYSTKSGLSMGADDFFVPPQKKSIIQKSEMEVKKIDGLYKKGLFSKEERYEKIIEIWAKTKSQIQELLPQTLSKENPVFIVADSGCRGSWSQPIQMAGMRGLMVSPGGGIIELPVKHSFKEGLGVLEYFISTHGARKGTSDTAMGTSKAGYLTRRLIDAAHDVTTSEEDCGDKQGLTVFLKDAEEIGQDMSFKIGSKICLEDVKDKKGKIIVKNGEIISWDAANKIQESQIESVRVRSPLSCQATGGICQKCYGWDVAVNRPIAKNQAVGITAAQSIGEPGTQLTLRTFHTGGVAGGVDITVGLPRIEELFERRPPKGEAVISEIDGNVVEVKKGIIVIKASDSKGKSKTRKKKKTIKKPEKIEYQILENISPWVEKGQMVKKGQQLCEGSVNLQKLFRLTDRKTTENYILQEIQRIYVSQGVKIHDKHVEVIIHQMFSRVKIKTAGDSPFVPGEIIERKRFLTENERLKKQKKKLAVAKDILLGISKVALTSDSVLSAASFQHTSKILIKAALEGKKDSLNGLKENVIIGKLIPVGTGIK